MTYSYPDVLIHIDGSWRVAARGRTAPVLDPATERTIGRVPLVDSDDLDEAIDGYLYTKFTTHRYSTRPVVSVKPEKAG